MASLGEFGAAIRELDKDTERDTFTFFGSEFTVVADIPPMLMLQLGAAATGKIDDAEGLAACWEALRICLDEPDVEGSDEKQSEPVKQFNTFYKLAVTKRADLESIMKIVFKLFEAQSGRPTEQAPGSSAGLPTTSQSSSGSSAHPALAHLRPVSEVLTG